MMRSERFLQKYRVLEGLLEKRYEGKKLSSSSVVMEYLRDDDSTSLRTELDLLREIRNLLSHNAGRNGEPVVEPSQEMLDRLDEIIVHVRRTRYASEFGTAADLILCAHRNDRIYGVMRNMQKNGYSHAPVEERGVIVGVFSIKSIFDYLAENGLDSLHEDSRIADLGDKIRMDSRYMFVAADTSIVRVRSAFERYTAKNGRLSAVFVTRTGAPDEPLICMLTPWDVLSDEIPTKEINHGTGKE